MITLNQLCKLGLSLITAVIGLMPARLPFITSCCIDIVNLEDLIMFSTIKQFFKLSRLASHIHSVFLMFSEAQICAIRFKIFNPVEQLPLLDGFSVQCARITVSI